MTNAVVTGGYRRVVGENEVAHSDVEQAVCSFARNVWRIMKRGKYGSKWGDYGNLSREPS